MSTNKDNDVWTSLLDLPLAVVAWFSLTSHLAQIVQSTQMNLAAGYLPRRALKRGRNYLVVVLAEYERSACHYPDIETIIKAN